jgi:hypothetical protein
MKSRHKARLSSKRRHRRKIHGKKTDEEDEVLAKIAEMQQWPSGSMPSSKPAHRKDTSIDDS